jgi:L-ascorbate 6-phosphate lactonase
MEWMSLSEEIERTEVEPGQVALFWAGQAGFVFKTAGGFTVAIDLYLSDLSERLGRNRRIVPSPIRPEELETFGLDLYLTTHPHYDHIDLDTLVFAQRNPRPLFAGPPSCAARFREMNIADDRIRELGPGDSIAVGDVKVTATYADHGQHTPDALGFTLDLGGVRVWQTGDTAYRPDKFTAESVGNPEIIIVCINGAFGNCNAEEGARLAGLVGARLAIPCHFWLFVNQNLDGGTPGAFIEHCKTFAPQARAKVLTIGRKLLYPQGVDSLLG